MKLPSQFKFLGRRLHGDCSEVTQREHLCSLAESLMATVDSSRLQGHQKLWLYHHLVVSKLSWSLKVLELSASLVGELQALYLRFLKTWVGLTRLVNPGILFTGCHQRFWNETPSPPYCVEKVSRNKLAHFAHH